MLIKLSFISITKIKQLFCVIRLLFIVFLVLVVVPITLAKQKERYMKGQLNVLGAIIIVLFTNKHHNDCAGVQHLLDVKDKRDKITVYPAK